MSEYQEQIAENDVEKCPECGAKLQYTIGCWEDENGNEFCDDAVYCINGCNLAYYYI